MASARGALQLGFARHMFAAGSAPEGHTCHTADDSNTCGVEAHKGELEDSSDATTLLQARLDVQPDSVAFDSREQGSTNELQDNRYEPERQSHHTELNTTFRYYAHVRALSLLGRVSAHDYHGIQVEMQHHLVAAGSRLFKAGSGPAHALLLVFIVLSFACCTCILIMKHVRVHRNQIVKESSHVRSPAESEVEAFPRMPRYTRFPAGSSSSMGGRTLQSISPLPLVPVRAEGTERSPALLPSTHGISFGNPAESMPPLCPKMFMPACEARFLIPKNAIELMTDGGALKVVGLSGTALFQAIVRVVGGYQLLEMSLCSDLTTPCATIRLEQADASQGSVIRGEGGAYYGILEMRSDGMCEVTREGRKVMLIEADTDSLTLSLKLPSGHLAASVGFEEHVDIRVNQGTDVVLILSCILAVLIQSAPPKSLSPPPTNASAFQIARPTYSW